MQPQVYMIFFKSNCNLLVLTWKIVYNSVQTDRSAVRNRLKIICFPAVPRDLGKEGIEYEFWRKSTVLQKEK